MNLFKYY